MKSNRKKKLLKKKNYSFIKMSPKETTVAQNGVLSKLKTSDKNVHIITTRHQNTLITFNQISINS